jgi:hypothetical protein
MNDNKELLAPIEMLNADIFSHIFSYLSIQEIAIFSLTRVFFMKMREDELSLMLSKHYLCTTQLCNSDKYVFYARLLRIYP